jgi:hypothetical protein
MNSSCKAAYFKSIEWLLENLVCRNMLLLKTRNEVNEHFEVCS